MSGKRIVGIILSIIGLIGAYYYIGGYFKCESQFNNAFGSCDAILDNFLPMMVASVVVLILGLIIFFKKENSPKNSSGNILGIPHPDTHVRCPDCREFVLNEASICKHCGCKLIPQGKVQNGINNKNITLDKVSEVSLLNFDGDKSLENDSYKIYLVKKYGIEKNEALGKIICQGKLFEDTEQALQHAAELDGSTSYPSNAPNVTRLTEIQKALASEDDKNKHTPLLSEEAIGLGITHDGTKYCYKTYKYEELSDALKFAKNDMQITSETKQGESSSNNKLIIAILVGVIVIIGGYFALQKNNCSDAKADVIKYMQVYANALYQGKQGMSVPGAAEAIAALEIAKKACNKPDLTVEEILNPQAVAPKSQPPQSSNSQASSNAVPYKTERDRLLKEGWRPVAQIEECSSSCQEWRKAGWIETESCAPTGVVPCIFVFRNQNGNLLKVYTEGEGDPWVVNIENISPR
jgi:hypothetical protein